MVFIYRYEALITILWLGVAGKISRRGGVITKFSHVCVVSAARGHHKNGKKIWMNNV